MNPAAHSRTSEGKSSKDDWQTPPWFYAELQRRVRLWLPDFKGYDLDAFATRENTLVPNNFLLGAYTDDWKCRAAFFNPPDKDHLPAMERAISEFHAGHIEQLATGLVRCGTATKAFRLGMEHASKVELIYPRLNYVDESGEIRRGVNRPSYLFHFARGEFEMTHLNRIVCAEYREPKKLVFENGSTIAMLPDGQESTLKGRDEK